MGLVAIGIAALLAFGTVAVSNAKEETFSELVKRLQKGKPEVRQAPEGAARGALRPRRSPAQGVTMARGKAVQEGVRVRLPKGKTWAELAALSPEEIKSRSSGPRASSRCRTRTTRRAAWSSRSSRSTR